MGRVGIATWLCAKRAGGIDKGFTKDISFGTPMPVSPAEKAETHGRRGSAAILKCVGSATAGIFRPVKYHYIFVDLVIL